MPRVVQERQVEGQQVAAIIVELRVLGDKPGMALTQIGQFVLRQRKLLRNDVAVFVILGDLGVGEHGCSFC